MAKATIARITMKHLPLLSLAPLLGLGMAIPAAAQSDGGDTVNQVIVYGDDECVQSSDADITVCARLPESERYRIPPRLRYSDSPSGDSWTARAESLEAVGRFGPLSCTPAGAGGDLGCTMKMIEAAYADKANSSDVRFGQLIAEARAERTADIDSEAAAEQARVEVLERAYMERLERERDEPLPGERSSEPVVVDPDRLLPLDQRPPAVSQEQTEESSSATRQGSVGQ